MKSKKYTDANLKKAWESYHPDVTAYVVSETSKDAATKALDAAKKDDAGKASFEKTNAEKGTNTRVMVSLENRMACGMGACLVCTCKTEGGNKKTCKDGPVFWGEDVIF